jgi:starvation-inducible outer membrane lipoprotein
MKASTIKALIVAVLLGLTLGITGCSTAPQEEPVQRQDSERKKSAESIMAPSPAKEGDDMERLD